METERYFQTRLVNDIEKQDKEYENVITKKEYLENGIFNQRDINILFGSWNEAINASDIEEERVRGANTGKIEEDILFEKYYKEFKTITEIAEYFGCSGPHIQTTMERCYFPTLRSKTTRKIIMGEEIPSEKRITTETRFNYGLVKENGKWECDLSLAHKQKKLKKVFELKEKYS